jgi:hypothetical protein
VVELILTILLWELVLVVVLAVLFGALVLVQGTWRWVAARLTRPAVAPPLRAQASHR